MAKQLRRGTKGPKEDDRKGKRRRTGNEEDEGTTSLWDMRSIVENPSRDPSATLEYTKGDHTTGVGYRYEESIWSLVFLRCLRRGLDFELSANNKDAGKFDDVALVWLRKGDPKANVLVVQVKHTTSTIHKDALFCERPGADFGIPTYCNSYQEKIENRERVTCVLLTNGSLGKCSDLFVTQKVADAPGLELLDAGGHLYKLNYKNVEEVVDGNRDFVQNFYLLCGQRDVQAIEGDICGELGEFLRDAGLSCPNVKDLCNDLCGTVRKWMKDQSVWVRRDWADWEALVVEHSTKQERLGLAFTTDCMETVRGHVDKCNRNPAWVVPHEKGTEALSAAKVWQALASEKPIVVSVEQFLKLRHRIDRCWGTSRKWLVIVDDDTEDNSHNLSELESYVSSGVTERRLVIVSSKRNVKVGGEILDDTFQSSDISDGTWEEFLNVSVRLNGERYKCRLRDLVAGVDGLKRLLDKKPAQLLALARLSQPLRMGQQSETLPQYYVPRKLVDRRLVTNEFFFGVWAGGSRVCVIDSASCQSLRSALETAIGAGFKNLLQCSVMSWPEFETMLRSPYKTTIHWPLIVWTDEVGKTRQKIRIPIGVQIYVMHFSNNDPKILYFLGHPDIIGGYAVKQNNVQLQVLDTESDIVIIDGIPGVGKSKLLSYFAKQIKQKDPACWVFRITLSKFYEHLLPSNDLESDAKEILKTTLFNKGELGTLEFELLLYVLRNSSRFVCLVDGFNEVCPDYMKKCVKVLPLLAPSGGKLLVTTRPAVRKRLEARLGVLAHSLEPFNDSELEEFFSNHPGRRNIPDIRNVNRGLSDLLKIPLFAEMFASLSEEEAESYDIVQLYEAFFQNEFKRYCGEKRGDNLFAPGKCDELKVAIDNYEKELMLLAASILLSTTKDLPIDVNYFVQRGIVYDFVDGKPVFLHRTFAEHFLAKWCYLGDGELLPKRFLPDWCFQEDGRFNRAEVYRRVYFHSTLDFFQLSFDRRAVTGRRLLEAVLDGNEKEVEELLHGGVDPRQVDEFGRNALHLASAYSRDDHWLKVLRLLCESAGKDALSAVDRLLGWTPMRYAAELECWTAVEVLRTEADRHGIGAQI